MKKLYTLLSVLALTATVNAQNLVNNGGFETWSAASNPDNWTVTIPASGGGVAQETAAANVQEGTSSLRVTAPAGNGNVRTAYTDIPVVGGTTYTFSYWYKDETDNARGRHWASWRTATAQLTDNLDVLQPDYQPNTTGWQQVTFTLTAPASATLFRLDFRVYQDTGNSGMIYYDNVAFGNNLSVKENNIAGLKVYPNPVTGGKFFISTDANVSKSVAIFDVLGKQVVNTTATESVNVSNLKAGVYIVKITEEGKTATRKLVIK